jgi:hypothetical protein
MSIRVVANANKWRWCAATTPPGCSIAGQVQSHALIRLTATPHKTIRPELSRIFDIPGFPRAILRRLSPAMGHSELHAGFEAPMVGSTPGGAYLDKLSRRELISRQALHSLRHDATLAARGGCRILPEPIVQRANAGIELTIATLCHEPKYPASGMSPLRAVPARGFAYYLAGARLESICTYRSSTSGTPLLPMGFKDLPLRERGYPILI